MLKADRKSDPVIVWCLHECWPWKKAPFFLSSSLFSEWGCSAVWHIHLLSSGAKLWQARWQKAVISPPPSVIQGQGVSEIPVKSLPAARLQWVSDDGTFHWVSVKANIHAKTEGEAWVGSAKSMLLLNTSSVGEMLQKFEFTLDLLDTPQKKSLVGPAVEQNRFAS